MRVRFIGDPRNGGEGPDPLSLYGVEFPKGQWITPDLSADQLAKLAGNCHFETEGGTTEISTAGALTAAFDAIDATIVETKEVLAETEAMVEDLQSSLAAFDHDGDGKPGGSLPNPPDEEAERLAIRARLKELGAPFPPPKCGLPNLRQRLADAEAKATA